MIDFRQNSLVCLARQSDLCHDAVIDRNEMAKMTTSTKSTKGPKSKSGVREGSKAAQVLDLLKRSGGATTKELMKATGWQAHSVRGFISGTLWEENGPEHRIDQTRGCSAGLHSCEIG